LPFAPLRAALALLVLGGLPLAVHCAADVGYATAEQAFAAAFINSGVGRRGYEQNREYAAALYELPDGRWYSTRVITGERLGSSIPYHLVPEQAVRIAGAHTHGSPWLPEDPSHIYGTDFSQTDRRNAMRAFRSSQGRIDSQFLLTSRLEVLRMSIELRYDAEASRITATDKTIHLSDWSSQLAGAGVIDPQPDSAAMNRSE
jgi:hypothetical protein